MVRTDRKGLSSNRNIKQKFQKKQMSINPFVCLPDLATIPDAPKALGLVGDVHQIYGEARSDLSPGNQ